MNTKFENTYQTLSLGFFAAFAIFILSGCTPAVDKPTFTPPEVTVSSPIVEDMATYNYFTGTTAASASVEVRCKVQGFLDKVEFKDGAIVKQDAPLFLIDQAPFKEKIKEAKARLKKAKGDFDLAAQDLIRIKGLFEKGTITKQDYDTQVAKKNSAEAAIDNAKAQLQQAEINLGYTDIRANIPGRIGRALADPGNLVSAETLLTTIKSIKKMHVYFDVSEEIILTAIKKQYKKHGPQTADSDAKSRKHAKFDMQLAGEDGYPHQGTLNFLDNTINPSTGTARVRGEWDNPQGLNPGAFARIRVPKEPIKNATLVFERAIGTDLTGKYIFVLGADNQVQKRRITIIAESDGLVALKNVIVNGVSAPAIKPDEKYIVRGIVRARPGMPVKPQSVAAAELRKKWCPQSASTPIKDATPEKAPKGQ